MTLITPNVWKTAMGLQRKQAGALGEESETQHANKSRARAVAQALFPSMEREFCRIKDDGRAEAMLLALYFANLPLTTPRPR